MNWSPNGLLPARMLLVQLISMALYYVFGSMKAAERN